MYFKWDSLWNCGNYELSPSFIKNIQNTGTHIGLTSHDGAIWYTNAAILVRVARDLEPIWWSTEKKQGCILNDMLVNYRKYTQRPINLTTRHWPAKATCIARTCRLLSRTEHWQDSNPIEPLWPCAATVTLCCHCDPVSPLQPCAVTLGTIDILIVIVSFHFVLASYGILEKN